jgi:hypothetical protein
VYVCMYVYLAGPPSVRSAHYGLSIMRGVGPSEASNPNFNKGISDILRGDESVPCATPKTAW